MLLPYAIVDFFIFYDGAVDMRLCPLLTRNQCRVVYDTQVTVEARVPLVRKMCVITSLCLHGTGRFGGYIKLTSEFWLCGHNKQYMPISILISRLFGRQYML